MVAVRPATPSDCVGIYHVHVAAVRGLPASSPGRDGVERWLDTREPAVYAQEMETQYIVVAEHDGEIRGWGAFSADKEEITNVFVHPRHHRNGVGTAIISALEDAARAAGLGSVHLQATGTAIDFYHATGYASDPPVGPGADWALMKKAL
jgi:putative acetyltransferase